VNRYASFYYEFLTHDLRISILQSTGCVSINCPKCYRLEECPKKNCTDIYIFVNTVYRQNFYIDKDRGLPICPPESGSGTELELEIEWKQLEIEGSCAEMKNQPCSISRFEIDGHGLRNNKLYGVFLGCPKPFLVNHLLNKYDCYNIHRRFENYQNGIVDPRNKFTDLILKLEQCHNNCSAEPKTCDLCFKEGCIHPSNTKIRPPLADSKALPISLALLGVAIFISVSAVLAYFCEDDRIGALDLIRSEDGSIQQSVIDR
jgi:hypothetical protein